MDIQTKSNKKLKENLNTKTVEELNALKEEVETLNKKLAELSEEELEQVSGGLVPDFPHSRPYYDGLVGERPA